MPENADAVSIYLRCRGQLIFAPQGMGGATPVDINHMPIHEAMRLFRVRDPKGCFDKVLLLAREFMDGGEPTS